MLILIVGCRRSGTTIFWEQLRRDTRFVCYDEPFNPLLIKEIPEGNRKWTRREFIDLHAWDPGLFWRNYAPITSSEEAFPTINAAQLRYLKFLADSGAFVVVDTTRCHFKLREIQASIPDTVLIHLHRSPSAFASSHIDPSTSGGVLSYGEFWTKTGGFNRWNIEEIIGPDCRGPLGDKVLRQLGLEASTADRIPAVVKLLAYWKIHFDEVEKSAAEIYGDDYMSVSFEDFCRQPAATLKEVYRLVGVTPSVIDFRDVRDPSGARFPFDSKWSECAAAAGLPTDPGFLFRDVLEPTRPGSVMGCRTAGPGSMTGHAALYLDRKLTGGALAVLFRHWAHLISSSYRRLVGGRV